MSLALKAENISKQYRLGQVGTGTLSHDLKRMWYRLRGIEDPFLKVGVKNDRTVAAKSDYVWALKDINFEINKGDVVGIIGRNGAGKSTLLKILSQITSPTTGEININGRIASLLEVGTGFHPDLTGRENIFLNGAILGMQKSEIKSKLEDIIEFSGCRQYIDTPVKRYSSGMMVRLGFAVAAHLESDILIVDEVLAVGDAEFQEKCLGKMKDISGKGRTILFVSHNMASMKTLCKRGIFMDQGSIAFQGTMNDTIEKYLSTRSKPLEQGLIPDGSSTITTHEARYTNAVIVDKSNTVTELVHYMSPIQLKLEIESKVDFADVILDVRIASGDGIELVYTMNKYLNQSKSPLKTGLTKMTCEIENLLQPGNYYITLGIHRTDGSTLEFVENIISFTVSKLGEGSSESFNYDFNLGHVRFNSKWTETP